jgi:excisionase family DNA binding protein
MAAFIVTMNEHDCEKFFREIIRSEIQKINLNIQTAPVQDDLLGIDQVKDYLKVSKVTIHKWKKRGLIKSHRIGRRIYFKKSELNESMKRVGIRP